MFSTVLMRWLRVMGRNDSHPELELCRVLILAGLPSTTPFFSALESLQTKCHEQIRKKCGLGYRNYEDTI